MHVTKFKHATVMYNATNQRRKQRLEMTKSATDCNQQGVCSVGRNNSHDERLRNPRYSARRRCWMGMRGGIWPCVGDVGQHFVRQSERLVLMLLRRRFRRTTVHSHPHILRRKSSFRKRKKKNQKTIPHLIRLFTSSTSSSSSSSHSPPPCSTPPDTTSA